MSLSIVFLRRRMISKKAIILFMIFFLCFVWKIDRTRGFCWCVKRGWSIYLRFECYLYLLSKLWKPLCTVIEVKWSWTSNYWIEPVIWSNYQSINGITILGFFLLNIYGKGWTNFYSIIIIIFFVVLLMKTKETLHCVT